MPLTQFDHNEVNILASLFKYGCILSSSYLTTLAFDWSFCLKRRLSKAFSSTIVLSLILIIPTDDILVYDIPKSLNLFQQAVQSLLLRIFFSEQGKLS